MWEKHKMTTSSNYISWTGKLSTLSRGCIHATEFNVPEVKPDLQIHYATPPIEPTTDQILLSLTNDCVVIYCDGSAFPNPGFGGAGLVVQDPSQPQWKELEFPINGITANYKCEIEAMKQALIYIHTNYTQAENRVIILCDCKFVINTLMNKWNPEDYKYEIEECQRILKTFNNKNVTEIYWIKGHSEIPGNHIADIVAKRARINAELKQPELHQDIGKTTFINCHGLNTSFMTEWNRHWINEGNETAIHRIPKTFLPDLKEAQAFERTVLHRLSVSERRVICRMITGKVGLNKYLYKIQKIETPFCEWCENEPETIEHFLKNCPNYTQLRERWWTNVQRLIPDHAVSSLSLKDLVIGNRSWKPETRVAVVKENSIIYYQN
ncbi:ribonuclease HI [Reticulomyxa filosa]|uniref:ribonuclease H n=1 Tax=Reticulomyxa filosa TaxID=46433 RepID=X6P4V9_RETFI|nr:ribonuclease HI [Reticulomyxa filosa]|eukprot:ETO33158.1 ribonuclease HI [Reticulomyxa filosa]